MESKTVLANYIIFVQQALLRIHYICITFLSILLILIKVLLKKYMRGDPAGAQLVVEEGRPTLLFLKIRKVSWIYKNGPGCVHFWVKFSVQNVVLRVSTRKNTKIFLCRVFFPDFLTKWLSKCPNFMKTNLPWKISGCVPAQCLFIAHWLSCTQTITYVINQTKWFKA